MSPSGILMCVNLNTLVPYTLAALWFFIQICALAFDGEWTGIKVTDIFRTVSPIELLPLCIHTPDAKYYLVLRRRICCGVSTFCHERNALMKYGLHCIHLLTQWIQNNSVLAQSFEKGHLFVLILSIIVLVNTWFYWHTQSQRHTIYHIDIVHIRGWTLGQLLTCPVLQCYDTKSLFDINALFLCFICFVLLSFLLYHSRVSWQ